MKKTILILAALLVISPRIRAFEPLAERELDFEYGFLTAPDIAIMFAGIFGTVFSLGNYSVDDISFTGQLQGQYYHSLGEHWMVGCSSGYEYARLTFRDKNGNIASASQNSHFMSMLPSAKLYWLSRKHFAMYTKVQAGATMSVMPDLKNGNLSKPMLDCFFSFSAVPAGMEFGGDRLRGFAELAFGTQGFLSIGIKKVL